MTFFLEKPKDEDMVPLNKEQFFDYMSKVTNDYRIEKLVDIFKEHAEHARVTRKEDINIFKENFLHETIPDNLLDNFNLAKALAVMANEIVRLKKALDLK